MRVYRIAGAAAAIVALGDNTNVSAQLTAAGPPFQVSPDLTVARTATVAMDASGEFVVAWSDDAGGGASLDVFARRFDSTGAPRGTEFRVNAITTGAQGEPTVAFIADGARYFVIMWSGQDSNYSGIRGNVFDANDDPIFPQEVVINATEQGLQATPAVTGTDTGFIAAWEHFPVAGADLDLEIRARTFGAGGVPIGSEGSAVKVPFLVQTPDVSADDDGNFVVVWDGHPVVVTEINIFGRRFDSGGSPLGTVFMANTYTTQQQFGARVQVGANGDFIVAWNGEGPDFIPYFQQFDSAGNKVGPGKPAAERSTLARPSSVDIALADDGSFATAYTAPRGVGPSEIAALSFDASATSVDSNPGDPTTEEFVVHDATPDQTGAFAPTIATNGHGRYVIAYGNLGSAPLIAPHVAARVLESGPPSSSTTTTTLPSNPSCGDPDGNGRTTASEALLALRTAVSSGTCPLCFCDIDGNGAVTATDALAILRAAVGLSVTLSCGPCQ